MKQVVLSETDPVFQTDLQSGAESPATVEWCRQAGFNDTADGSGFLLVMHCHGH